LNKLELINSILSDKKAENIKALDLRKTSGLHDYAIICDASNPRLLFAIRDYLMEGLQAGGYSIHHVEGRAESDWLLIDAFDVCIHLFLTPARHYYQLEDLWRDKVMSL